MFCSPKRFVWASLFVLALVGIWLVWFATPYGMGLTDDSIAYIGAARTLLEGRGYRAAWLASQRFLTHFPPAFPASLALIDLLTGLEPYRAARLLNGVLFGLNTFLMGWLGWRMTRQLLFALTLALLFLMNSELLRVHVYALSEPLFIFLTLSAFHAWLWGEEHPAEGWLRFRGDALAGLLSGLAYLTRYAALALIATFLILPFFLPLSWRERLKRLGIYLVAFFPLPLAWSIRNLLVVGDLTNRTLLWHPVTIENLRLGAETFSRFLLPLEGWRFGLWRAWEPLFPALAVLLFSAIALWLLYIAWNAWRNRPELLPERGRILNALYVIAYPASMLASISLFDASTPLNWRILSPFYPSLLALAVAGLDSLRKRKARYLMLLFLFGLVSTNLAGAVAMMGNLRQDGQGFASWRWFDSPVIKQIPHLPAQVRIYTNQGPAVYFYTGRTTYALPTFVESTTRELNSGVEQSIERIRQEVLRGEAVIALFDANREDLPQEYSLVTRDLPVLHQSGRDILFGIISP